MAVVVVLVVDVGTEKVGMTLIDAALDEVNEGRVAAAATVGVGAVGTRGDGSAAGGAAGRGGRSKAGCNGRKAQVIEKEAGSGAAYCDLHLSFTHMAFVMLMCDTRASRGLGQ